jgi:hypothetical protein
MRKTCILLLVVALVNPNLYFGIATSQETSTIPKGKLSIMIVPRGEATPDGTLLLRVQNNGTLKDIDFHDVTDKALTQAMRESDPKDQKTICRIKLVCSSEQDTSIASVGRALRQIKRAADPERDTIVYTAIELR